MGPGSGSAAALSSVVDYPESYINVCVLCIPDGLDEDWGDDAVLNQVLAVSQHEYLRSLHQQQQQQEGTDNDSKV